MTIILVLNLPFPCTSEMKAKIVFLHLSQHNWNVSLNCTFIYWQFRNIYIIYFEIIRLDFPQLRFSWLTWRWWATFQCDAILGKKKETIHITNITAGCRKMLCFVQFWTRKSGTKSIKQRWRTGRVVFYRNFKNDKSGARNDIIKERERESHNVISFSYQTGPPRCRGEVRGIATPALLCHKEPA